MSLFGPPDIEALKRKKDVRKLVKAVSHSDAGIRAKAVEALGSIGDPTAVDVFVKALDDPDPAVVKVAALALGRSGDVRAFEPLLAHAAASEAIYLQAFGSGAFFDQLQKRGNGAMVAVALSHSSNRVRAGAAAALAKHPHSEALPALLQALDDDDRLVRHPVMKAIQALGPDERAVEPLIRRLRHPAEDTPIRRDVAAMLGDIGDDRAVAPLIEALDGGAEGVTIANDVLVAAARALARFGDKNAVTPLVKRLGHESAEVAAEAARALGSIKDVEAFPSLLSALQGEREGLHASAAIALGELGDARANEPLRTLLNSSNWRIAVHPLARLNPDSSALKALASFVGLPWTKMSDLGLGIPGVGDRWGRLIESFRRNPDMDAVPPLTAALEDDEFARSPVEGSALSGAFINDRDRRKDFRLWLIDVLAQVGDERALTALERCRTSDNWVQYPDWSELTYGRAEAPRREAAAAAINAIRQRTGSQA